MEYSVLKQRIAKFQCVECGFRWQQNRPSGRTYTAGEASRANHSCRMCGHLYIKWLNYEEEFAK